MYLAWSIDSSLRGSWNPVRMITNIILIPNKEGAVRLEDFRTISLCHVRYKIISKILVSRIRPLLQNCISEMQGAFLPGRRPSDNLIIAKEVLHVMSQTSWKKTYCALKLDVRKAYDRLSWRFIQECLLRYGFSEVLVQRIMTGISTVTYRVVINGQLSEPVRPNQGLCQGDPLSPYLYILCEEVLTRSFKWLAYLRPTLFPVITPHGDRIPLLQYADDTLLFIRINKKSASLVRKLMNT